MSTQRGEQLPPKQSRAARRAVIVESVAVGALALDVALLYATMGTSQAMKTAWLDNTISMVPPLVFLVANRVRKRAPSPRYPYGFHRVVSIAFLLSSFALLAMGAFLLGEAISDLATGFRPTIGTMILFGRPVWAGWPMIAAATWSGVTAGVLGRQKVPLARVLNDRVLHADADMSKADWLVSVATVCGVLGVGFGLWWADAVAAALISTDILWDGLRNLRAVFGELIDRTPDRLDTATEEPIVRRATVYLRGLPWVRSFAVRFHQRGHILVGEVHVVPVGDEGLTQNIETALSDLRGMDWRLQELTITPVHELPVRSPVHEDAEGHDAASPAGMAGIHALDGQQCHARQAPPAKNTAAVGHGIPLSRRRCLDARLRPRARSGSATNDGSRALRPLRRRKRIHGPVRRSLIRRGSREHVLRRHVAVDDADRHPAIPPAPRARHGDPSARRP
jgi:cation diffusion facilitator family transporter